MNYTEEELRTIEVVMLKDGDVWNDNSINEIKRRIKLYFRNVNSEQCCYCKRDLQDEFNLVIDIEHILPKGNVLFRQFMFDIENLNISCKRCNMKIKNKRVDFIVDLNNIIPDYKVSSKYLFIHPNFDNYFDHIDYESTIKNNKKLIKYIAKTEKGAFTYDYFHLDKIEINTLNIVQGVEINNMELNSHLSEEVKTAFLECVKKI